MTPEEEKLVLRTTALVEVAQALVRSWTLRHPAGTNAPIAAEEAQYTTYINTVVHPPGMKRAPPVTPSSRPTPQSIRSAAVPTTSPVSTAGMPKTVRSPDAFNTSVESAGGATASSTHNTSLSSIVSEASLLATDVSAAEVTMMTLQKDLLACTVYLTKLPALAEPKIRRLLFAFGEVHKVRMYREKGLPALAAAPQLQQPQRGAFGFAEFAQPSAAKAMIDYFRNCGSSACPFYFLRQPTPVSAEAFTDDELQQLLSARASYARSAIHDQDPRDAVFDTPNPSSIFVSAATVSDAADGSPPECLKVKSRRCTYGVPQASAPIATSSVQQPPAAAQQPIVIPTTTPASSSSSWPHTQQQQQHLLNQGNLHHTLSSSAAPSAAASLNSSAGGFFRGYSDEEQLAMLRFASMQMGLQEQKRGGKGEDYVGYSTYSAMLPEADPRRRHVSFATDRSITIPQSVPNAAIKPSAETA
jgi:hypothetical protein